MAAAATCLRTVFRSSSFRNAVVKIAADAKASRSPFPRLSKQKPKPSRLTRSPMRMSCCVESLLPLHSANASAILNSMLAIYRRNYWLYEGGFGPLLATLVSNFCYAACQLRNKAGAI